MMCSIQLRVGSDPPAGSESEDEGYILQEQSPPKWTPLPPPNVSYILWNTMSRLSDKYIDEREKEQDDRRDVEGVLPTCNRVEVPLIKKDSDIVEPMNCGEAGNEFVEEGDNFLNMSVEDEQAFDALIQEDLDFVVSQGIHQPQKSTLSQVPLGVEASASVKQNVPSMSALKDVKSNNLMSRSPVDIYEIGDDFDDISTEDLNLIDETVELYVKNSPDSSSSDESLPPVPWGRQSTTATKHNSKSRTIWLPLSDSISTSHNSENCLKGAGISVASEASYSEVKDKFSGGSTSQSHHLALKQCFRCYFKFPPRYVPNMRRDAFSSPPYTICTLCLLYNLKFFLYIYTAYTGIETIK